jgi:Histidine kinase-, DNA gyrase B-, and HSP90-like ATPase
MKTVQVKSAGIKRALKKYDYSSALAEYIWNAFDAKATEVNIEFSSTKLGAILSLKVIDNGDGICDAEKFEPIFESDKVIDLEAPRQSSSLHGKNGFGRLTFFKFAESAKWETFFKEGEKFYSQSIEIQADQIDKYLASDKIEAKICKSGTIVSFDRVHTITIQNFETDIKEHLCREFSWFLELNIEKKLSIKLNGIKLAYKSLIVADEAIASIAIDNLQFEIKYIRWSQSLSREYSRYYLIDSTGQEKRTSTTTFNKKGDTFYHSVFVKSAFFDNPQLYVYETALFKESPEGKVYKEIFKFVDNLLREKRRIFIRTISDELINNFEKNGVFPKFGNQMWDQYRKSELENVIKDLFRVEPKIFSSLSKDQKKIFVRFLNVILEDGQRDKIFEIIDSVINLDSSDIEQLSASLKTSNLSNIIKTIQLLEDRYKVINQLKGLVFNRDLKANERDHLQKFIEHHYWIFGEEYTLITAEEPDFEEALRRYNYLLRGETAKKKITHPDKQKEMDIFMVRRLLKPGVQKIEHVVVELKHPLVNIGEKQLTQVKKYMNVILSQDEFNAPNMTWKFYLIGNDFDTSGDIEGEFENAKSHGESSLVYSVKNYKIYVKKWSEIFTEFDLKHDFLYKKLSLEREKVIVDLENTENILKSSGQSSAKQEGQIEIPKTPAKSRSRKAQ